MLPTRIEPVTARRKLRAFVRFPWRVYQGDPNWVPPLISERLEYLDPARGPFYRHADVALFLARRGREVVGTIAAFVDHDHVEHVGRPEGGFGFFEVVEMTAREVLDYCRQELEPYKIPSHVQFVDEFPRSTTGKPQKFRLRETALRAVREGSPS